MTPDSGTSDFADRERARIETELAELRGRRDRLRAERAEERLAETTRMLFDLSRDAVAVRPQSSATEVMVEGRSVLRLSRPIGMEAPRELRWPQG